MNSGTNNRFTPSGDISMRANESTDLQKYLLHVEERQRQMDEHGMMLLSELDKMDHQTEIMAIQVEKLQILKDQCYHILKQQQLTAVNHRLNAQLDDTSFNTYQPRNDHLNRERNSSGIGADSYFTSFPDISYKYSRESIKAPAVSFPSQENSDFPGISNMNLGNNVFEVPEHKKTLQQIPPAPTEPLNSSTKAKIIDAGSHDLSANKRLSVENQIPELVLEEARLMQSTPCEESKQASVTDLLVNASISTVNLHNIEELTFRTADSKDVSTEPLLTQPAAASDLVSDPEVMDIYEEIDGENDVLVATNEEEICKIVSQTENVELQERNICNSLQIETALSTEEEKITPMHMEVNVELDSENSPVDEENKVEFQNQGGFLKPEIKTETVQPAANDVSHFSEQQIDSTKPDQNSSLPSKKTGASQSLLLNSRNLILSDSEISDNNDIPLTSSAAYQSLIGAGPVPQQQQKLPLTSGESESEDDVEKAMAMAVKLAKPKAEKTPGAEGKQPPSTTTEKASVVIKPRDEQPRKSISSTSNYKNKLSKATRKVLGLDSDSDDASQNKSKKDTVVDDDDEFDFFD